MYESVLRVVHVSIDALLAYLCYLGLSYFNRVLSFKVDLRIAINDFM